MGANIPIPRGLRQTQLADAGLVGKVSVDFSWTAEKVARELTSIFATVFKLEPGQLLPFE